MRHTAWSGQTEDALVRSNAVGPGFFAVMGIRLLRGREFEVRDTGPGIPQNEHSRIFEKFYRAHDSLSSGIQGSGLGLTLARQIGASQAEAECYRQLAECYLEADELERAVTICQAALDYAHKIGDRKEQASIDRVLGKTYLRLHDPSAALLHLERSTQILRELNREFDLAMALSDYAQALIELEQVDQSRDRLREALTLFQQMQLPQEQAKIQATLDRLTEHPGRA